MITLKRATVAAGLLMLIVIQNAGPRVNAALAGTIHYPDLQTVVPLDEFFITRPTPQMRELNYTHIIANLGDGPLEIEPAYDPATDSARGQQILYTHNAVDFWTPVAQRPIVGTFKYHAEHGHTHFPLARFGLHRVEADGSVGPPLLLAPKVGYCIADWVPMQVIPHFGVRGYGAGACSNPGATMGISVGHGDLYNWVDVGQNLDLTALPDGVYWFRAISDPFNYFVEKDESNNVTDIQLQISGTTVTPLTGEIRPDATPPTVTVTAPVPGQISGTSVMVSADAIDPSGIASVQFILDGEPLGVPDSAPPYTTTWDTTTVRDGVHYLSAHAEAGSSFFGSATPVVVTVANGSAPPPPPPQPVTITNVAPINRTISSVTITWTTNVPATSQVDYGLTATYGSVASDAAAVVNHALTLTGLSPATTYHYRVTSRDGAGNEATAGDFIFSTAAVSQLSCTITAPAQGSTVTGVVSVTADAVGTASIAGVQFVLDGASLGAETAVPPYSTSWNTTLVNDGQHTLSCIARDPTGNTATAAPVSVTVANVQAAPTGLVAAYGFDEGTGSSAFDASGNANTGSLQNATWTTDGRFAGAVSFNGSSSWVSVADSPTLDLTQGMTLEAWVNPTSVNADYLTVVLKERPGGLAYALYAAEAASPPPPAGYVNIGGADRAVFGSSSLPVNAWSHLAVTYNGTTLRLYVNGIEVGASTVSGTSGVSGSPLRIGGNGIWGEYFNGTIDEVRVYNRALTPSEIQFDMNVPIGAPDSTPPTVAIVGPSGGAVSGTISVTATAQDDKAVAGVQFLLDGVNLGSEDLAPPYSISWNTTLASNGSHTLAAIARDSSGNTATAASVVVNVDNADTTPPTVAIGSPAAGASVAGSITVTATAGDNVGVVGVRLELNGAPLGAEDLAAPYSVSWDTTTVANGTHTLTAVARDAAGNSTRSAAVSVTVNNPVPDTTPPTVNVTSPSAGATVSGTVAVTASAGDGIGIAGVQFKLNGQNLGAEDLAAPYSVSWDTTTALNGPHVLTATARDAAGNRTDSAAVAVSVSNVVAAPTGLVAAYSFDAASGSTAADASGNGNNGTISGAIWTASGRFGQALAFDGVNDWVTVPDAATLDLTRMTLEAWVYPTGLVEGRTVVLKETAGGLVYSLYGHEEDGQPVTFVRMGGVDRSAAGNAELPLNTWTHLAASYDGTALRLFINGLQVSSTPQTGNIAISSGPLRIGGNAAWGEFFEGLIDEVRVYNRALSQAEIETDMNTPVRP